MSFAMTKTRSSRGIHAAPVTVEVHLSRGLPAFTIVGLAETAVRESKDRVRSAIINSRFEFPKQKITVSLAPADLPKTGSGFDIPIALGILAASKQIPAQNLENHEFIGELALNGHLRSIPSIIPIVLAAKAAQSTLIIAEGNAAEAAIAQHESTLSARSLNEIAQYLCHGELLSPVSTEIQIPKRLFKEDWSDIKGQHHAKKAFEIAATGGHSLLVQGPPGSGKTMLAKRLMTIMPPLAEDKALETAAIYSTRGQIAKDFQWKTPPFRAPHHTASAAALVGGGNPPKPGEISLAHHGILFLDELPEFSRRVLETLREPIESGHIVISRAATYAQFPAQFQLIAAMNPCPCGYATSPYHACVCSVERIQKYIAKLSGPFLDRIDMQVSVLALTEQELMAPNTTVEKISPQIQSRIQTVQAQQIERQDVLNAHLDPKTSESVCAMDRKTTEFLSQVLKQLKFSARAYHRLLKVARTIADMAEHQAVQMKDIKQALSYKQSLKNTPNLT